jgi:hypothetical protein
MGFSKRTSSQPAAHWTFPRSKCRAGENKDTRYDDRYYGTCKFSVIPVILSGVSVNMQSDLMSAVNQQCVDYGHVNKLSICACEVWYTYDMNVVMKAWERRTMAYARDGAGSVNHGDGSCR